jgi:isocitrate lyase
MRLAARRVLGHEMYFDWEKPRTREGYYRVNGGVDMCVARGLAFAPYSDIMWMETGKPDLEEARHFARGVRAQYPTKWLAYNLSPSFSWSKFLNEEQCRKFTDELGNEGFVWQFITLAGFHSDGLIVDQFAKAFAGEDKMWAYVRDVQNKERDCKVETLTHQKWSGAEYLDHCIETVMSGMSSTKIMQDGVTESQFHHKTEAVERPKTSKA